MEITNCDNGYKALEGEVSGICSECGDYDTRPDDVCSRSCFNAMMR